MICYLRAAVAVAGAGLIRAVRGGTTAGAALFAVLAWANDHHSEKASNSLCVRSFYYQAFRRSHTALQRS